MLFVNSFSQGMEEQREEVRAAYQELREHYPALPEQLRDFQVGPWEIEGEANINIFSGRSCHIMGALPSGYGKSLPMLVTGLLMPTGKCVNWSTAGVKICQSSFLTEVLYDRFNSHGHHRLDYDCSAVDLPRHGHRCSGLVEAEHYFLLYTYPWNCFW